MSEFEAWAVWNDCNGIFEVCNRRADAEALLDKEPYQRGRETVVPVVVTVETEDRHWYRERYEDEHVRLWSTPQPPPGGH